MTIAETANWLSDRQLKLTPAPKMGHDHGLEIPDDYHRLWFETPSDARRQTSLAHLLSGCFMCEAAALIVTVVTLFEPHEIDAFLFLRHCHGESRWIDGVPGGETPGHLFSDGLPADRRNVREFMSVMMAYTFEGYFVQQARGVIIWVADEIIDVAVSNRSLLAGPSAAIRTLGLRIVGGDLYPE